MRTPLDVTGLGLSLPQSAVLAAVAEQGMSTAVHLSGRLALSAETVSRAVSALCDYGLLERGTGRPRPLTLAAAAEDGLERLKSDMLEQQRLQRRHFGRARRELTALAAQTAPPAPEPTAGLVPARPVPTKLHADARHPVTSWDEILTAASHVFATRGHLLQAQRSQVRVRLLVTGRALPPRVLAGAKALGADVRHTSQPLARLLVLDGAQARMDVTVRNATRQGWTADPGQVRLLQDGFDAAWARAG